MSFTKMEHFTTWSKVHPASFNIAPRFCITRSVSTLISLPSSTLVTGSSAICPETYKVVAHFYCLAIRTNWSRSIRGIYYNFIIHGLLLILEEHRLMKMRILVVGNKSSQDEFKSKFGSKHSVRFKTSIEVSASVISGVELIIDFETDTLSARKPLYGIQPETPLMVNSVFTTVKQLVQECKWTNPVIGFNGMPGFFNRSKLEIATYSSNEITQNILSPVEYRLCYGQGQGWYGHPENYLHDHQRSLLYNTRRYCH